MIELIQQTAQGWWVLKRDIHFSRWVEQAQRLDHDQPVLQKLVPYLKPGSMVIDVGAGIGDHTKFYLDQVGPHGMVIAFEPHPTQYECLIRNCPDAYCHACAVGETKDHVRLYLEPDWVGSSRLMTESSEGTLVEVPRLTIDGMNPRWLPIAFLKIDCEGCEPEVLRGARKTILRDRPAIWMEVNPQALVWQKHSSDELRQVVAELGYEVKEFYPPGSDWDGCQGGQCDILCLPK